MRLEDPEVPVFDGYRLDELQRAFDAVADPTDWRNPIAARVSLARRDVTLAAIEFYTATKATVAFRGRDCLVQSVGYRMGPAGDH